MYNDLFDLRPTNKEVAFGILAVFALLLLAGVGGYLLGVERTQDLYDNGGGAGQVGGQLEQAEVNQHAITDGISHAEGTGQSIAGAGHAIAESAGHIAGGVTEAAGLIDECQQILGRIRNRGQAHSVKN